MSSVLQLVASALPITAVAATAAASKGSDVMDETPLLVLPLLPVLMPVRDVFLPRAAPPKLSLQDVAGDSGTLKTAAESWIRFIDVAVAAETSRGERAGDRKSPI